MMFMIHKHDYYLGFQKVNIIRYQIPDYVLMNATQNPLNAGFYSFAPSGMMNLTAAVNAPVMASKPSFLDAGSLLLIGEYKLYILQSDALE